MSHAAMAAAEAAEKAVAEAAVAGTLVWEPRERGEVPQGPEVYIVTTFRSSPKREMSLLYPLHAPRGGLEQRQ